MVDDEFEDEDETQEFSQEGLGEDFVDEKSIPSISSQSGSDESWKGRYENRSFIVDSFIKVLELVLLDKDSIDAVVLTRFDLRFRAEITALNVMWNVTNAAHKEGPDTWEQEGRLSDLFFVLPIGHVETFIESLKVSATRPHNHRATGAGHWVYNAFVRKMGDDPSVMRVIDSHCSPSTLSPCEASSFLAVSRTCGVEFK